METNEGGALSIISSITDNADQVWKGLVCPPKIPYSPESLGPPKQAWGGTTYRRIDREFTNRRGQSIKYTYYQPDEGNQRAICTVVYFHSHGGCKIEGYHLMKVIGKYRFALCLFDFAGSGHSDGDYISMGIKEQEDAAEMIDILKKNFEMAEFIVWGRSMGAAVALQSLPLIKDRGIKGLVLDSPFATVASVYRNAVQQRVSLPGMLVDLVFSYAASEIRNNLGFDVEAIRPFDYAKEVSVPTVLIGAKEDLITSYGELLELYEELPLDEDKKVIVECVGKHNDDRDPHTMARTVEFLSLTMNLSDKRVAKESLNRHAPRTSMNMIKDQELDLPSFINYPKISAGYQSRRNEVVSVNIQRDRNLISPIVHPRLNSVEPKRIDISPTPSKFNTHNLSQKRDTVEIGPNNTTSSTRGFHQKKGSLGVHQYSLGSLPQANAPQEAQVHVTPDTRNINTFLNESGAREQKAFMNQSYDRRMEKPPEQSPRNYDYNFNSPGFLAMSRNRPVGSLNLASITPNINQAPRSGYKPLLTAKNEDHHRMLRSTKSQRVYSPEVLKDQGRKHLLVHERLQTESSENNLQPNSSFYGTQPSESHPQYRYDQFTNRGKDPSKRIHHPMTPNPQSSAQHQPSQGYHGYTLSNRGSPNPLNHNFGQPVYRHMTEVSTHRIPTGHHKPEEALVGLRVNNRDYNYYNQNFKPN